MKEIDHHFTNDITCPYCGYEHEDSHEWEPGPDSDECENCGKEFGFNSEVSVNYCTYPKEDWDKCETCGEPTFCLRISLDGEKWICQKCRQLDLS